VAVIWKPSTAVFTSDAPGAEADADALGGAAIRKGEHISSEHEVIMKQVLHAVAVQGVDWQTDIMSLQTYIMSVLQTL
jgi:hypothetical protein